MENSAAGRARILCANTMKTALTASVQRPDAVPVATSNRNENHLQINFCNCGSVAGRLRFQLHRWNDRSAARLGIKLERHSGRLVRASRTVHRGVRISLRGVSAHEAEEADKQVTQASRNNSHLKRSFLPSPLSEPRCDIACVYAGSCVLRLL
jgi:hypothetical protein